MPALHCYLYGSKGSAGVILINTKRGSSEKPIINVSTKIGVSQATFMPDAYLLNSICRDVLITSKQLIILSRQNNSMVWDIEENPNSLPEWRFS